MKLQSPVRKDPTFVGSSTHFVPWRDGTLMRTVSPPASWVTDLGDWIEVFNPLYRSALCSISSFLDYVEVLPRRPLSSATSAPLWPWWNIKQQCFPRISMLVIACDRNGFPVTPGFYEEGWATFFFSSHNMCFDCQHCKRWYTGKHFYRPSADMIELITAAKQDGGLRPESYWWLCFLNVLEFPKVSRLYWVMTCESFCNNLFQFKKSVGRNADFKRAQLGIRIWWEKHL